MSTSDDEDSPLTAPKKGAALLPTDLSPYSVQELQQAILGLQAEIARLEVAIAAKTSHRSSAESLFRS